MTRNALAALTGRHRATHSLTKRTSASVLVATQFLAALVARWWAKASLVIPRCPVASASHGLLSIRGRRKFTRVAA